MKPNSSLVTWQVVAVLLSLTACSSASSNEAVDAANIPSILIRNVSVIPMDQPGVVSGQDVLVAGGRIVAIGRTGAVPASRTAKVIDGSGGFLMPGLWDMHVHATSPADRDPLRYALPLHLSYGIVGVRDMGATLEAFAALKTANERAGLPEVIASGPLLDGPPRPWQPSVALPLTDAQAARDAVRKLANAGSDFIKVYDTLTLEQYAAVAAESDEIGLPFAGHVPMRMTVEEVSLAGQKSIEHVGLKLVADCIPDGQKAINAMLNAWVQRGFTGKFEESRSWWQRRDADECRGLYARLAQRGTWVTPTLSFEVKGGGWTSVDELTELTPELFTACEGTLESIHQAPADLREAYFDDLFELVRELHESGVLLLAGSDVPNACLSHGRSLHTELQLLRHAGLSEWETLKTATLNPARFLGRPDEGLVRQGAVANLLLLDANPLEDVANTLKIRGILLAGTWHDATALQQLRDSATGAEMVE
jgi:hypothetical protein